MAEKKKQFSSENIKKKPMVQKGSRDLYIFSYTSVRSCYGNNLIANSLDPYPAASESMSRIFREFGIGKTSEVLPNTYKILRNRVLYPVRNVYGLVEGFLVYNVGNEAYPFYYIPDEIRSCFLGFYQAASYIRSAGFVYLVRDFREVLLLHSVGIKNVLACNTKGGVSDAQIEMLSRYTENIILLYGAQQSERDIAINLYKDFLNVRTSFKISYFPLHESFTLDTLLAYLGKEKFFYYIRYGTRIGRLYRVSDRLFSLLKEKQGQLSNLKTVRERLAVSTELIVLRKKLDQTARILHFYTEEQNRLFAD